MSQHSQPAVSHRTVVDRDLELLLDFMREFYLVEEHLPYDRPLLKRLLGAFIHDPQLGRIWLVEADGAPAGDLILTFGWSFEYHGRDGLIDEFFIKREFRGRGVGTQTLEYINGACRELGVHALHLEVDHTNSDAERLYRRTGFAGNQRALLTRWLMREEP